MVFNNSRVRRARIIGVSQASGAKAEFLLLKKLDDVSWHVLAKRSKRRKPASRYIFGDVMGEIVPHETSQDNGGEGILTLRFDRPVDDAWLDVHGQIPLPPYIKRCDSAEDGERYQTVYAQKHGSAAAPTAGLHFTEDLLGELEKAGIEMAFVTLHVGLGTFLPVRTQNIEDHLMHEETCHISSETARRIETAKNEGRKILAVGTTCVRTLESAWEEDPSGKGKLGTGERSTSIFIRPGYTFKVVDALFTNFHTPESTLLMLVSAFAGKDFILESYAKAVEENYRFFSYGDACLIT
jgi:S-adenosylmethionine:tRNA ribosyltransferase-isomerase